MQISLFEETKLKLRALVISSVGNIQLSVGGLQFLAHPLF